MARKPRDKMPVSERAKQFMPFAALRGLNEALEAKEKESVQAAKPELTDDEREKLGEKLSALKKGQALTVFHYRNGSYTESAGTLTCTDISRQCMFIKISPKGHISCEITTQETAVIEKILFDDIKSIKTETD